MSWIATLRTRDYATAQIRDKRANSRFEARATDSTAVRWLRCRALERRVSRGASFRQGRGGVRVPARALPRRGPGLQRHLPDRARGPRHGLGRRARRGALRGPRPRPRASADVVIGTDAATWLELREGKLSGLDAFRTRPALGARQPRPRGRLRGLLPAARTAAPPLLRVHEVEAGKARISTLTAGNGVETVILIHGLGGNKSSFYETVSALTPHYTVHAIDLPGFGSSSKPARAPYDAGLVRALGRRASWTLEGIRPRPPGRQLAGRPGRDRGRPDRARPRPQPQPADALARLAQAPRLRADREAAAARAGRDPAHACSRAARPPPVLEHVRPARAAAPLGRRLAVEEFLRHLPRPRRAGRLLRPSPATSTSRSRSAPTASGPGSPALEPPAMFVWGDEDPLVPLAFSRHVARGPAGRASGRAARVRPRAPGRAARGRQRPDPRLHRRRRRPPRARRAVARSGAPHAGSAHGLGARATRPRRRHQHQRLSAP